MNINPIILTPSRKKGFYQIAVLSIGFISSQLEVNIVEIVLIRRLTLSWLVGV